MRVAMHPIGDAVFYTFERVECYLRGVVMPLFGLTGHPGCVVLLAIRRVAPDVAWTGQSVTICTERKELT